MLLFKYDFSTLHDSQRRFNGGSTVGIPFSRRGVKRRLHQTEQWLMWGRCSVTAVRKWLITQLLCKSRGRLSGKPILRRLFGLTASCPVLSGRGDRRVRPLSQRDTMTRSSISRSTWCRRRLLLCRRVRREVFSKSSDFRNGFSTIPTVLMLVLPRVRAVSQHWTWEYRRAL